MKEYLEILERIGLLRKVTNHALECTEYYISEDYELTYYYDGDRIIQRFEESYGEIVLILNDADYDNHAVHDVTPADITIIKKTVVTLNELLGE